MEGDVLYVLTNARRWRFFANQEAAVRAKAHLGDEILKYELIDGEYLCTGVWKLGKRQAEHSDAPARIVQTKR